MKYPSCIRSGQMVGLFVHHLAIDNNIENLPNSKNCHYRQKIMPNTKRAIKVGKDFSKSCHTSGKTTLCGQYHT